MVSHFHPPLLGRTVLRLSEQPTRQQGNRRNNVHDFVAQAFERGTVESLGKYVGQIVLRRHLLRINDVSVVTLAAYLVATAYVTRVRSDP